MSARMTADALERARDEVVQSMDLDCACGEDEGDELTEEGANGWHENRCLVLITERAFNAVVADHDRARAEEELLAKENAEQAATIKALADALWDSGVPRWGDWHNVDCHGRQETTGRDDCTRKCATQRAALRLAGRLT